MVIGTCAVWPRCMRSPWGLHRSLMASHASPAAGSLGLIASEEGEQGWQGVMIGKWSCEDLRVETSPLALSCLVRPARTAFESRYFVTRRLLDDRPHSLPAEPPAMPAGSYAIHARHCGPPDARTTATPRDWTPAASEGELRA